MDDDELKKDDELEESPEEDLADDDILLGGKARKRGELSDDPLGDDLESIDDLAALEDEDDEPYDDVDRW